MGSGLFLMQQSFPHEPSQAPFMSVLLSSEIPAISMLTVFQDFSSLHLLTFSSPHFKRFQRLKNHMGRFSHSGHRTLATDFLMLA